MPRHPHDRFGLFAPWDRFDPWSRTRRDPRPEPARPRSSTPVRPLEPEPQSPRVEHAREVNERPVARPVRIVRGSEPRRDVAQERRAREDAPIETDAKTAATLAAKTDATLAAKADATLAAKVDAMPAAEVDARPTAKADAISARDDLAADDELARVRARLEREAARQVERERRALLGDFIEILDDLDRALVAGGHDATSDASEVIQGVRLVRRRFLDKLGHHGARRVDVAPGDTFDAASHEAIAAVEAGAELRGRVVEVLRPAYFVGDELLRPGQVVVGR